MRRRRQESSQVDTNTAASWQSAAMQQPIMIALSVFFSIFPHIGIDYQIWIVLRGGARSLKWVQLIKYVFVEKAILGKGNHIPFVS